MRRCCGVLVLGLVSVLALSPGALGADEASPAEFLKSKGLNRVNQLYVLPDEAALAKSFHDLNPLHRKVLDAQKKSDAAEKKVQDKKDLILAYTQERRELRARESNTKDFRMHNKLVDAMNELYDRTELLTSSHKEEDEAKKMRARLDHSLGTVHQPPAEVAEAV